MKKVAVACALLAAMATASAAQRGAGQAPAGCVYGPRGGLHCNTVRFERQTDAQRRAEDRRLRAECKGRPNAGACAGYTR